jgi:cytochrome bd-type quinol oxidase subunit 2
VVRRFTSLVLGLVGTALIVGSAPALAFNPLQGPCTGNTASAVCNDNNTQQGSSTNPVNHTLQVVSNVMALLTGVVAVGMIIGSGLVFVTGGSNPERTKKARAMLQAAIIGLIIVALAWTFVTYVVQKLIQ